MGFDDTEYRQVLPVAERLLSAPTLQRFFDPALYRRAWNEIEMVCSEGRLQRIDRLVECDGVFWVLDYKSSSRDMPRLAEYREQLAGYCRAVAEIFPERKVCAALIFSDATVLEVS